MNFAYVSDETSDSLRFFLPVEKVGIMHTGKQKLTKMRTGWEQLSHDSDCQEWKHETSGVTLCYLHLTFLQHSEEIE